MKLTVIGRILGAFSDKLAEVIPRKKCFRKERHFSKGSAEAQMRSIMRRGLEKDPKRIHVYVCPECTRDYRRRVWHVGHAGIGRHATSDDV